ncbi:MAG: hypothetical protein JXB25_02850 [Deltaproteobacteria bacterium]|nr:hypothetical protein [Deltaproteobacteria bacterium]
MDGRMLGSFLLVLGLILVVVAGYFLRSRQGRGRGELVGDKRRIEPAASGLWVWIGRVGSLVSIMGTLLIVLTKQ